MQKGIFPTKYCLTCSIELVRKVYASGIEERTGDYRIRRYCSRECGRAGGGRRGIKHILTPEGRERLSQKTRIRIQKMWIDSEQRANRLISMKRTWSDLKVRDRRLRRIKEAWSDPKRREAVSGERSVSWRGGITKTNARIRRSYETREWKRAVLGRDNYTCVLCGTNKLKDKTVVLHVDHIQPFALFPKLRFNINNGRVLCKKCHLATDTYGGRAKKLQRAA